MLDTLAVMAYLLGSGPEKSKALHMAVSFPEKAAVVSPVIRWKNVPPEAESLAVVIQDNQKNYYWVAYNLPADAKGLPLGANQNMLPFDEGVNSFGEHNYHSPWSLGAMPQGLRVELYALDKRFSIHKPLSGNDLYAKIKGHTLLKTKVVL
ncbi:MAG: hypothetical protein Q8L78_01230 [Coxiellaceae bacterium]|nr:hypothetical protein [Coxiellaceae bacterium]